MENQKKLRPTVDQEDYQAIDRMAGRSDVSASWLIRRSMREFLDRHRENGVVEVHLGRRGA
jgi:predicted transcriptional regulator